MIQPLPLESPTSDDNTNAGTIPNLVPFLPTQGNVEANQGKLEPFTEYEMAAIKHRIAQIAFDRRISKLFDQYVKDKDSLDIGLGLVAAYSEHESNYELSLEAIVEKYPEIAGGVLLDFVLFARPQPIYRWGNIDLKRVYRD